MTSGDLVVDGGRLTRLEPFAPWPCFAEDEIEAVSAVMQSGKVNYWTGEEGRKFEAEFAAFSGAAHAVALANGTVALELALRVLGIGQGDEVIVTSRTFIASASCIIMCGATPVFADVDPQSQNITADTISAVLSERTKAIIAVHLAGWPCDMDPILALAKKHSLKIVEDCAQAHGACYKGRPVGSIGDIAAFSFCQDKIMTTGGEGGMLTTNDRQLWEHAWSFKDHGKSFDGVYNRVHPQGFRWLHESFGTNLRLTEMQSCIGRIQLRKLKKWLALRKENARILTEGFSGIAGLRVSVPSQEIEHSYYKYYVYVRPEMLKSGWDKNRLLVTINAEGIPCFSGSCGEIYLEKAFQESGAVPAKSLPIAKELGMTSLMFMVHPTLGSQDMDDTCRAVKKVMYKACA